MANKLKSIWKDGRAAVNGWLAIPSGFSAEVMAQSGWDSVTVDLQHGVLPMVRVPWNEPGIIGKVLDGGAYGVICPMVNTKAEAEAFVSYCRYPPAGKRSNGPIRASMYGVASSYQATANDEILCIPMIETQEAVDNLEAILDVPGIDAVYIGPSDLGFSMGLVPILDREEAKILAIYDKVLAETKKRGIIAGLHNGTPEYAAKMIQRGFRLVTVSNDSGLMQVAARNAVRTVRDLSK